ncbi:MAG: DUF6572 domain-containing protein [Actinophytocola sp.]|uniref:DUF6572 domain-containing protein n=1 Tax=Actinophytocola sp. TaxID=1872138 RepID=UPI003D6C4867
MSGIADATTIDLVAQDAAGEYMVVMVEDRPWDAGPVQQLQLRDKINLYADFINSGDLVREYPETAGKPVRIHLDCVEEPTGDIATVVEYAAGQLRELGIDFTVNVRG